MNVAYRVSKESAVNTRSAVEVFSAYGRRGVTLTEFYPRGLLKSLPDYYTPTSNCSFAITIHYRVLTLSHLKLGLDNLLASCVELYILFGDNLAACHTWMRNLTNVCQTSPRLFHYRQRRQAITLPRLLLWRATAVIRGGTFGKWAGLSSRGVTGCDLDDRN